MKDKVYTVKTAALILNLSASMVRLLISNNEFPGACKKSVAKTSSWLIPEMDMKRYRDKRAILNYIENRKIAEHTKNRYNDEFLERIYRLLKSDGFNAMTKPERFDTLMEEIENHGSMA